MTAKQIKKQTDARVERAYYAKCSGIQINVMDIGKVFDHGRELVNQGLDDEALGNGILAYVQTIRAN